VVSKEEAAARAERAQGGSWRDKPMPIVALSDNSAELGLLASAFNGRCLYHLSLGETDKAWHDVRLLHRLLELSYPQSESSMGDHMRLQMFASKAAESVLLYGGWESNKIRQALQELTASHRPPTDADVQRMLTGERLRQLADFQQNFPAEVAVMPFPLPYSIFPLGRTMVAVNRSFDAQSGENFRKNSDNANNRRFIDSIEINDRGYVKRNHIPQTLVWHGFRNSPAVYVGVNVSSHRPVSIADHIAYQTAEAELTRLVFALELYRKEHEGRYPATLSALCDGYIEKVPVDPFSDDGAPMTYRVNDDRTGYLVYSVGRNRIDDGGEYDPRRGFGDIRRKWNYGE